ncbi:hypothetical protein [Faecalicatena contorta]|nr:hypothetical protein [Faecalicatena contorta]
MKKWVIFGLFLIVGIGMLIAGLFYMNKEKKILNQLRFIVS